MSTGVDIVVVGGGVVGLSVAYFLAEHASVLVLEREDQPAYHASGRSAAMLIEGYESGVVSDLTSAGRPFLEHPPEGLAQQPLLSPRGGVTAGPAGDESLVDAFVDTWRSRCPNLQRISVSEAQSLLPFVAPSALAAACYDPDWLDIDVHELLLVYQRGLAAREGTVRTRCEVELMRRDGNGWLVTTSAGELVRCTTVVNAAGAWGAEVAKRAGLDSVPLTPMRRTALLLDLPAGAEHAPLLHVADGSLYCKPEGRGLMVSPADETPSAAVDAAADELDIAIAVDRYEQLTGSRVARVPHTWAGLRTFSADRRPVVGRDPRAPEFFWLVGQGGFGVQTSPGLSALAADVLGGRVTLPAEIAVDRFVSPRSPG